MGNLGYIRYCYASQLGINIYKYEELSTNVIDVDR